MLVIRPGRQLFVRPRLIPLSLILLCICTVSSCGRNKNTAHTNKGDIGLDQDVTNNTKPQDVIFVDFQKNWKKFISSSPELTLPVVAMKQPAQAAWQPLVSEDCVFSADAGGNVPQVTLTWNEAAPSAQQQLAPSQTGQTSPRRFDLALHYQGFERNYFTTAISTEKLKRFNLPSNSALIANPDALLLTGPGLFPKLVDFHTQMLKAPDTNVEIPHQTLVLRDLAPGLAYRLREATLANNQWNVDKQVVFSTPICPNNF
jgi:hypothetical protein